ncbi:MAG: carboxylesterase family protein [Planctomycetota bacterium]|jgi:dienelactone hydrolase
MRFAWLIPLILSCPAAAGNSVDRATLKKMEAFGVKWWKARPKSKFQEWPSIERTKLLEEARAFGEIPEGSWVVVRDTLWKSVKKHGPKGKGRGKVLIENHGYKSRYTQDEMWARFSGTGKKKGLVMSLHGGGEGAGSSDSSWGWKGCMTIAPQGLLIHGDNWNRVHGEKQILTFIEIAKAQFDIDPDRVYCCGFSMGGTGSWHMAGRYPDLFAGAAPGHGVVMAAPKSQLKDKNDIASIQYGLVPNTRNLAVYYFTGTEDVNCMPGTFLFVNDLIQELKAEDPGGYSKVRFKCWPGVAHSYPPGEPGNCIEFLSAQRRDSYPQKLVWVYASNPHPQPDGKDRTRRRQQNYFYYVRHDRPEDRMEVVVERDGNDFTVTTSADTEGMYLMLNPKMIDVSEPVVVKVEDEVVYRSKPVPDFATIVESLDDKLDKSLTFDRKIPLWKK